MTTIDNNELYAILRDVANQSLTVGDAQEKIQDIKKSDMKVEAEDEPTPAELAQDLKEEQLELIENSNADKQPNDSVTGVGPEKAIVLETNEDGEPEVVTSPEDDTRSVSNKRKPRK